MDRSRLARRNAPGENEVRRKHDIRPLPPDQLRQIMIEPVRIEDALRQAGIEEADAFVAVTSGDNTNIVAAQIARHRFRVPKSLARVYDPIRAEAYREAGIDTICSTIISAGIFRDLVLEHPLRDCKEYLESFAGLPTESDEPEQSE